MIRPNGQTKVVLGLSGGVDSAVAAHLLTEAGFDVHAVHLKNWTERDVHGVCPAERDRVDALRVAAILNIPCVTLDYEREYRERVFAPYLEGLGKGATPNPDMLCNPLVKFEALIVAADRIGAPFIATGHYARRDGSSILAAHDTEKDQSYFLSLLTSAQIERTIFPVGELSKREVRAIARDLGLPIAEKESTSGICFIGERDTARFLRGRVSAAPGPVVDTTGASVSEHCGLPFYTIGQRHGFGGGGGMPYYVAEKRIETNTLVVAPAYDPSLFRKEVALADPLWHQVVRFPLACRARIRYRQPLERCTVSDDGTGPHARFENPQRAVTPGQYAVFYAGDRLLGAARIR